MILFHISVKNEFEIEEFETSCLDQPSSSLSHQKSNIVINNVLVTSASIP